MIKAFVSGSHVHLDDSISIVYGLCACIFQGNKDPGKIIASSFLLFQGIDRKRVLDSHDAILDEGQQEQSRSQQKKGIQTIIYPAIKNVHKAHTEDFAPFKSSPGIFPLEQTHSYG